MTIQLQTSALGDLAKGQDDVALPGYDRAAVQVGIVHLGVGGFHRAHQAMYLDRVLASGTEAASQWGICGVGVLPHDARIVDTLTAQDGLYTLTVQHPDGTREDRVIGSIVRMLLAPADPQAVIETMAAPATRIVSLTITEGGYAINPATGEFDPSGEAIANDLTGAGPPRTAFGLVIAALAARKAAGIPPFTILSCDNLPHNGDVARSSFTAFARLREPELAAWMDREVSFPNCMVDRITPATTEEDIQALAQRTGIADGWPVVCEPFTQWVLEDAFVAGRPELETVGVQIVDDVVPFELMKLRMLNAGHQAIAYLAHLMGYHYAHEAAQDESIADLLHGYLQHEAAPTLPPVPETDLDDYRRTLLRRFANPEVGDTIARLAAYGSDRIPKFLIPVIEHNLAHDGVIDRSALVVAAWARYNEGTDEQGEPIDVVDERAPALHAAATSDDELAFLADRDLFGDLVDNPRFTEAFRRARHALRRDGARATVGRYAALKG